MTSRTATEREKLAEALRSLSARLEPVTRADVIELAMRVEEHREHDLKETGAPDA